MANGKAPKCAAVAFVGKDADLILGLSSGDQLVCAMADDVVGLGLINPFAVEALIKGGVIVRRRSSLHAKVLVFGGTAVVGSMNGSKSSQGLLEAGFVTTDKAMVSDARRFVQETFADGLSITKQELNAWKTIWRKRPKVHFPPTQVVGVDHPTEPYKLFIGKFSGTEVDRFDEAAAGRAADTGRRVVRTGYSTDWRVDAPYESSVGMKCGDWLLDVVLRTDTRAPVRVKAPAQVVSSPVVFNVGRGRRALFHIRWKQGMPTITFNTLAQELDDAGLVLDRKRLAKGDCVRPSTAAQRSAAVSLWNWK